ncbi:hypothetical protein C6P46_003237 [Rhodotorula mucilaginosa]|uniref:Uncharacterized protein n=1 Tax=Rhodotorula mucilaginosa TaxID=5537 RepID=A0A9P6W4M2_RHOMI|nr:hypothetical protein C6P46_003237 [Rhodotorula mucilaginosa]
MDPRDTSRKYLNDLDRRTAIEHLHHAVDDTALAAHRFGDIVRRDGEDVWKRFDRRMEDSRWPGGGPNRHAADFTEWDGMKKLAADAYHEADADVTSLRSRLKQSSIIRNPFLDEYSTHDLQNRMALHAGFAKRYAKYAWRDPTLNYALQDGTQAVRQGGMYARDAFEVTRRQARDALFLRLLRQPMRDRLFKRVQSEQPASEKPTTKDVDYLSEGHRGPRGGSSYSHRRPFNVVEAAGAAALAGVATAAGLSLLRHERRRKHIP